VTVVDGLHRDARWESLFPAEILANYTHHDVIDCLSTLHSAIGASLEAIHRTRNFASSASIDGSYDKEIETTLITLETFTWHEISRFGINKSRQWDVKSPVKIPRAYLTRESSRENGKQSEEIHGMLVQSLHEHFYNIKYLINHIEYIKTIALMNSSNNHEFESLGDHVIELYTNMRNNVLDIVNRYLDMAICHCHNFMALSPGAPVVQAGTTEIPVNEPVNTIKHAIASIKLPSSRNVELDGKISRILGENGPSSMMAWESGYECPRCHTSPLNVDGSFNEVTCIQFSKHPGMLRCPACNVELPAFACIHPKFFAEKKDIEHFTLEYINFIESCQKRAIDARDDLATVQSRANNIEWKAKYEYLVESLKSPLMRSMMGPGGAKKSRP
jgi:hypothetical protein